MTPVRCEAGQHIASGTLAEKPRTLFEKIWDDHVVASDPGAPAILAIDLHLVHEVTSPQAFTGLRERGLKVHKPGQTVATADHSIPTLDPSIPIADELAAKQLRQIEANCREFGIPFHGQGSATRGIVRIEGNIYRLTIFSRRGSCQRAMKSGSEYTLPRSG